MTDKEHRDPVVAVETLLNEMFQQVFNNDAARHQFGFSKVSQITTLDGLPQWYLWFSEKKGAFSLTIQEEFFDASSMDVHPYLLIRYFPSIEEADFHSLSCIEQIVRTGSIFDSTGTPTFEGSCSIDKTLFVTGRIDITIRSSKSDLDFLGSAPDRWKVYRSDGLALTDGEGKSIPLLDSGELDRDFPGWDLTFFLMKKLVSAYCFMSGQAPHFAGCAEKPSCHYLVNADQVVDTVLDSTVTESILGVSFFESRDGDTNVQRYLDFEQAILAWGHQLIDIWSDPKAAPEPFSIPEWWHIPHCHFHADASHVCSCYK